MFLEVTRILEPEVPAEAHNTPCTINSDTIIWFQPSLGGGTTMFPDSGEVLLLTDDYESIKSKLLGGEDK
jgi:hypothetical protein